MMNEQHMCTKHGLHPAWMRCPECDKEPAKPTAESMDNIESLEFYDLMQAYRHTSVTDQAIVVERYEAVKKFIHAWAAAREWKLREGK